MEVPEALRFLLGAQFLWFEHGGKQVPEGEEETSKKAEIQALYPKGRGRHPEVCARHRPKKCSAVVTLKPPGTLAPHLPPSLLHGCGLRLRGWAERTQNTAPQKVEVSAFVFSPSHRNSGRLWGGEEGISHSVRLGDVLLETPSRPVLGLLVESILGSASCRRFLGHRLDLVF